MRKPLLLLVSIVLLVSVWTPVETPSSIEGTLVKTMVTAVDYHYHTTLNIGWNGDAHITWELNYHDGIYGNFAVTSPDSGPDQIIDFFICDEENFNLWDGGETASVYHLEQNVADYSFEFRVPSSDTWYFVFKNWGLFVSKEIDVDLYRDDTPPDISMNLIAGSTCSGNQQITATITEATFDISSVSLYIDGDLKRTEYDSFFSYSWDTEDYSNGAHTIRISASDNVGNSGYEQITVYVSNAVGTTGSTGTTGSGAGDTPALSGSTPLMMMAGIGLVAGIGIAVVLSRRRSDSLGPDTTPVFQPPPPPPESEIVESHSTIQAPEVPTQVVCPFCGSRTQAGLAKCDVCGAEL
ncbi:MAG: Ig-like domain-containing protein [Candidatus Sifarchaeia archaeon]